MNLLLSILHFACRLLHSPRRWWLRRKSRRMTLGPDNTARLGLMAFLCFFCLSASTPRPPMPKRALQSPKSEGVQVNSVMAVPAPPKRIMLSWEYSEPIPQDITFNLFASRSPRGPFQHAGDYDSSPVTLPADGSAQYFICRASNRITSQVSGWNVKGKP